MDNINNKFIVLLLAEDNFEEEFKKFSEEDQQAFIDFFAEIQAAGIRAIKEMPLAIQIEALLLGISMVPLETRQQVSTFILSEMPES